MRSKRSFETARAWRASSCMAARRTASSGGASAGVGASAPAAPSSRFVSTRSICALIFARAKSSAPQVFANTMRRHRTGTNARIAK